MERLLKLADTTLCFYSLTECYIPDNRIKQEELFATLPLVSWTVSRVHGWVLDWRPS